MVDVVFSKGPLVKNALNGWFLLYCSNKESHTYRVNHGTRFSQTTSESDFFFALSIQRRNVTR